MKLRGETLLKLDTSFKSWQQHISGIKDWAIQESELWSNPTKSVVVDDESSWFLWKFRGQITSSKIAVFLKLA